MSKASGAGSFAAGLIQGYTAVSQIRMQQEKHNIEIAKARDEQAMRAELKGVEAAVSPTAGFAVVAEDGTKTIFTDKALADEAARANGAQMQQVYTVGGKTFESQEQADVAAEAANAPAAKLRKRADIALKYNRPDLANDYSKSYATMLESNRRDLQESYLQSKAVGDYASVLDGYNRRLPNGLHAEMVTNDQGGLTLSVTRNGQPITQKQFTTADDFWSMMDQTIAQTPDNMLETWKTRESLATQKRGLDIQERKAEADIASDKRRLDQGDRGLVLQGRKLEADIKNDQVRNNISAAGVATQQAELGLRRELATRPDVVSGVNPVNGNVVFSATERYRNPTTKEWGLRVLPSQEVPSMAPTRTAAPADPLAAMLGGAGLGAQAPMAIDWSKLPPKNVAPTTARPAAPLTPEQAEALRRQQSINSIPR